jgi:hypothetical protein
MKTTIEIPNDLLREAKARAAQDGISFRALLIKALTLKLHPTSQDVRRVKCPIIKGDPDSPPITPEIVEAAEERSYREDDDIIARFIRR